MDRVSTSSLALDTLMTEAEEVEGATVAEEDVTNGDDGTEEEQDEDGKCLLPENAGDSPDAVDGAASSSSHERHLLIPKPPPSTPRLPGLSTRSMLRSALDLSPRLVSKHHKNNKDKDNDDVFHSADDLLGCGGGMREEDAASLSNQHQRQSRHASSSNQYKQHCDAAETLMDGDAGSGVAGDAKNAVEKKRARLSHHAIEVELQRRESSSSVHKNKSAKPSASDRSRVDSTSSQSSECCSVRSVCGPSPWRAAAAVAVALAVWALLVVGMNWQKRITSLERELSTLSAEVSRLRLAVASSSGDGFLISNKSRKAASTSPIPGDKEGELMCVRGGDRCSFPFRFRGELHYRCITVNSKGKEDSFAPWCAVSVDPLTHEMTSKGAWGRCRPCSDGDKSRKTGDPVLNDDIDTLV